MNEDIVNLDNRAQDILSRYTALLKDSFKGKLLSVAVFGSVARGTANFPQSDIDVLIVLEGAEKLSFGERFKSLIDVEEKLSRTEEYSRFKKAYGSSPNIQEIILAPVELRAHPPVILDLTTDVIIIYDTGILKEEIKKLKKRLQELGARRVVRKDSWFWILKPDLKLGETVEL
jgi:predicted nucleotidyltransferase